MTAGPAWPRAKIATPTESERTQLIGQDQSKVQHLLAQADEALAQFGRDQAAAVQAWLATFPNPSAERARLLDDAEHVFAEAKALEVSVAQTIGPKLEAANAALRHFKLVHHRDVPAVYAPNLIGPSATLVALIAVEAAVNAFALETASSRGLIGGFGLALAAAAVNVMLAAGLVGFLGLRLIIHVQRPVRAWGLLLVVLGGGLVFAWNFGITAYRESLAATASLDPGWGEVTSGMQFSVTGVFLLTFGLLTAAFAAAKGRGGRGGFCDPYWGYRARTLAVEDSAQALDDAHDDHEAILSEDLRDVETEIQELEGACLAQARALQTVEAGLQSRAADLSAGARQWAGSDAHDRLPAAHQALAALRSQIDRVRAHTLAVTALIEKLRQDLASMRARGHTQTASLKATIAAFVDVAPTHDSVAGHRDDARVAV